MNRRKPEPPGLRKSFRRSRVGVESCSVCMILGLSMTHGCSGPKQSSGQTQPESELVKLYAPLRIIDAHNHGAADPQTLEVQASYSIDATVLFGAISEPAAVQTDAAALELFAQYPDRIYPYFTGIPLCEERGVTMANDNLDRGYFGIGEIVAASTYSPVASKVVWKASNPNGCILPELYSLANDYGVPVLLHIDPPVGEPIDKLEEALTANPETTIIFGHINAFSSPDSVAGLLDRHPNLYADFFAGFTAYNPESTNTLADFVPVVEAHSDRFVVSTDSGYDIGLQRASVAIYELLDLLTPETVCRIAYQNIERLMEQQLPTRGQIHAIENLSRTAGRSGSERVNKRKAHELIFDLRAAAPAPTPVSDGIHVELAADYWVDGDCPERVREMRATQRADEL